MTDDETRTSLRALLDKQEIQEVLRRYCRGIDRRDEELLRSVYHPDAIDNHGMFNGMAAEFIPWALKALERDECTTHFVGNELIDLQGEAAFCESYLLAVHRRRDRTGATVEISFGCRYVDRFERREGAWKIAHRQVVFDWGRIDPVEKEFSIAEFITGKRSREDPRYRR